MYNKPIKLIIEDDSSCSYDDKTGTITMKRKTSIEELIIRGSDFKTYCKKCNTSSDIYEKIKDVPLEYICKCGEAVNVLENLECTMC